MAVATTADDAAEMVRAAVRALDKAAQKGIVHRNAAARRKSRLMTRLYQLSVAATTPAAEATAPTKAPTRRATTSRSTKSTTARKSSGSTTTSRTRRATS